MSNTSRLPSMLLRAMLDCFATGNVDDVARIVSKYYYDHQSSERPRPHGPELFRSVVLGARMSLPALELEVDELDEIDSSCAESRTRWHWTDSTGKRRVRTTIDRVRVEDGQVVEHWGRELNSAQIERLTTNDVQRYKRIRLAALADAPDAFGRTLAEEEAFGDDQWHERLANSDGVTFVAVKDDVDVGLVGGVTHWDETTTHAALVSMWVAPQARRGRVGVALVQQVIDWARRSGFVALRLEVADNNAAAIDFYENMGFAPTGRKMTLPQPREHITEHERILFLGSAANV